MSPSMALVELATQSELGEDSVVTRAVSPAVPTTGSVRLAVHRVAIWSLARTALLLASVIAAALVAGGIGAWWLLRRSGLADGIEGAVASGLGMESYALPTGSLLLGWTALATAGAALAVLLVALLGVAFNALGGSMGGVIVEVRAERAEPTRP
jgi:hypothetical protein